MAWKRITAALAATLSSALLASNAQALTLGPGDTVRAPIVDAENIGTPQAPVLYPTIMCSTGNVGTITDPETGQQQRVALIAGHCIDSQMFGDEGDASGELFAATADQGDVYVGNVKHAGYTDMNAPDLNGAFNDTDWAVVEVADPAVDFSTTTTSADERRVRISEPVNITGIRDLADVPEGQFRLDTFGRPICKDGSRTGRSCGTELFRVREGVWAIDLNMQQGDSGGPTYDPKTGEMIGMNSMIVFGGLSRTQPADRALQEAYGIPDGQVNNYWQQPAAATPHTEMRALGDDLDAATDKALAELEEQPSEAEVVTQQAHEAVDSARAEFGTALDSLGQVDFQNEAVQNGVSQAIDGANQVADDVANQVHDFIDDASL